uniref:Uncharacterized protein n=1 Tax=Strigamia maritima TaxID=126957 RepID=T1IMQ1_STRMM
MTHMSWELPFSRHHLYGTKPISYVFKFSKKVKPDKKLGKRNATPTPIMGMKTGVVGLLFFSVWLLSQNLYSGFFIHFQLLINSSCFQILVEAELSRFEAIS